MLLASLKSDERYFGVVNRNWRAKISMPFSLLCKQCRVWSPKHFIYLTHFYPTFPPLGLTNKIHHGKYFKQYTFVYCIYVVYTIYSWHVNQCCNRLKSHQEQGDITMLLALLPCPLHHPATTPQCPELLDLGMYQMCRQAGRQKSTLLFFLLSAPCRKWRLPPLVHFIRLWCEFNYTW